MADLIFIKASQIPTTWQPDAVYFIKNNGYAESFVTATDGTPEEIGNTQMIEEIVNGMDLTGARFGIEDATSSVNRAMDMQSHDFSVINSKNLYLKNIIAPGGYTNGIDITANQVEVYGNHDRGGGIYDTVSLKVSGTDAILIRPGKAASPLATMADIPPGFSGDYNDLINKPIIPSKTSQLTNDVGFITIASVPTKTSQLTNDAGYYNAATLPPYPVVPSNVSAFANDAGYLTNSIFAASNLWTALQEIRISAAEQLRLSYDATHFTSLQVTSTGLLTISPTPTTWGTILNGGFTSYITVASANLAVAASIAAVNNTSLVFAGATGNAIRVTLKGATSTTPTANYNYSNLLIGNSPVTKAASGTHNIFANCVIQPIGTIGAGASTLNYTSSLYIEAANTAGSLGNYALWVDDGRVRFDATLNFQTFTNSTPVDGDIWWDGTSLRMRIAGVTKTFTIA